MKRLFFEFITIQQKFDANKQLLGTNNEENAGSEKDEYKFKRESKDDFYYTIKDLKVDSSIEITEGTTISRM